MPFPEENEFVLPDGITLNAARDSDGVLWTCATLDGWGSPGSKSSGTSREGEHGDSPAPNPKMRARTLQMTGRIDAPTRLLRQQAENRLQAALGLDLFDLTVVDAIPLRVQAQRAGDITVVDDTDRKSTWQAELKCPDPRRYGDAQDLLLNLPSVTGGVRFPIRFPVRFTGSSTSGDDTVVNSGNETAPATVTFTGPLTTPKLTNLLTGQWVQYNDTLAVGEFVVLYLRNPMVALLQGTAERTGKVSTGGGGTWGIKPGANPISFRAAAGSGTALLEFSDCYM
jgi:hypothetical protein